MEHPPQTRKERLEALAKRAGSNAALGRKLGYKDGALIWQMLNDMRPITEKFIAKVHAVHEWRDWFSETSSPPATEAPITLEQAMQAIDAALEPLHGDDRIAAVNMLADLAKPGRASSVATMFSGAVQAMSSKRKAA